MTPAPTRHDVGVLVVGAGPVGLVAAAELSHHGVPVLLADRSLSPTEHPKMDITNARSMELLARLGMADDLRRVGVAPEHSFDVVFATGLGPDDREISRWALPSVDEARRIIAWVNDGSMPTQPAQRCAQSRFERLGRDRCAADPLVDLREGWRCDGVVHDDDGATASFTDVTSGEVHEVRARWVVACDGGGSVVRRSLGVGLDGIERAVTMALLHIRSRDLGRLHRFGQFWHVFLSGGAVIIAQDEVEEWTVHVPVTADVSWADVDPVAMLHDALGAPVEVDEVLLTNCWSPSLVVAEEYRVGRVFLAGDAAHQFIPTGGYGMNTGVGDAVDIGWKLAAVERGWGGPALLDSYAVERRPVAVRNRDRSARHAGVTVGWPGVLAASGDAAAATYLQAQRGENESFGIELDQRLAGSPVVVDDGTPEPPWDPMVVTPSARPGHRLPALVMADGRQLHDLLGGGFTLLVLDDGGSAADGAEALVGAAAAAGVPLTVAAIADRDVGALVERALVLVRPDGYVAWRGDGASPAAAAAAVEVVRGAAPTVPVLAAGGVHPGRRGETTMSLDESIDWDTEFDHFDPRYAADPQTVWRDLRQRGVIARGERFRGMWVPVSHADVSTVAEHPELFSSRSPLIADFGAMADFGITAPPISSDPPYHTGVRRMLLPFFGPKRIEALRPGIEAHADELIDAFAGSGGCDAATDYARHIPVRVIATMLGVPLSDEDRFFGWVHQLLELAPLSIEQGAIGLFDFFDYFHGQLDERRVEPRDDLMSFLLDADIDGRVLETDEILGICLLLLLAGIDTTWSSIGAAIWHFAQHPEQRARLAAEPELWPSAVEELLRCYAPVTMAREVAVDTDVLGCPMHAGDPLLLPFPSANRDPEVFPDPDEVILDRGENRHLAFGLGIHRCLGSNLARLEVSVAVRRFLERIPEFELAGDVTWSVGQVRGPRTLPLRLA